MNFETDDLLHLYKLPLLQVRNDLGIPVCARLLYDLELLSSVVFYRVHLRPLDHIQPACLHIQTHQRGQTTILPLTNPF